MVQSIVIDRLHSQLTCAAGGQPEPDIARRIATRDRNHEIQAFEKLPARMVQVANNPDLPAHQRIKNLNVVQVNRADAQHEGLISLTGGGLSLRVNS